MKELGDGYDDARRKVLEALLELPPGVPMGPELYEAWVFRSVNVSVEAVCLRQSQNGVEVLLFQRPAGDLAYKDRPWHCPGTGKQKGDSDRMAIDRLASKEFKAAVTSYRGIGRITVRNDPRGHYECLVFLVEVAEGHQGQWWPVNSLPKNIVASHRDHIIPMAVANFTGSKPDFQEADTGC